MQADLRLGQIRSGQMKKDPPRSESDPLKVHISEIITALVTRVKSKQKYSFPSFCPQWSEGLPREARSRVVIETVILLYCTAIYTTRLLTVYLTVLIY